MLACHKSAFFLLKTNISPKNTTWVYSPQKNHSGNQLGVFSSLLPHLLLIQCCFSFHIHSAQHNLITMKYFSIMSCIGVVVTELLFPSSHHFILNKVTIRPETVCDSGLLVHTTTLSQLSKENCC